MKIKVKYLILAMFAIVIANIVDLSAQKSEIYIQTGTKDKRVGFAADEIKKAAVERGLSFIDAKSGNAKVKNGIFVRIISDSAAVVKIVNSEKLKLPGDFGWQCYSIRIGNSNGQKVITVLTGDNTGAMYGGLDIAEAIRLGTIDQLTDSDHKPYLERRGIKFNIPLDLRTPSYSDMGDAAQQNIPVIWDFGFWQQHFDEMARNRMNVISFWSENPFPSLVKIPEFPKIALDDVWRTKIALQDNYNLSGRGLVTKEMMDDHEVVKKISIDQKIRFWRDVMQYAHDRGIEVYWFTWNIFTYGIDGKYGIDDRQNNDTTIAYFRSAVREMVLTYPNLDGFGITAGENMQGNKSKYSNEEWLWKTYGLGVSDALNKQPDRKIRLIHRFHQTNFSTITEAFKDFPGKLDLSYKYSIAHMYAVPDPPYIKSYMHLFSQSLKTWLTVRNDDIFSFRWGSPGFARQYVLSIPETDKIAGFYMGPDGFTLGRDFLGKDNMSPRPLFIQKHWFSFMLWGRLSYDPMLSDELFQKTIQTRFSNVSSEELMNAWSDASMIFPWVTRFIWGDVDYKWFPEASISRKTFKGFYTVKDFMEVEPQPGSKISNIIRWAQNYKSGKPDTLISPLDAADTISKYVRLAQINLKALPAHKAGDPDELNQTIGDIEAFSAVGNYYAEKIRGAASLALYNFYGIDQDREEAIQHLQNAKSWWIKYAEIYDSQYKPVLISRVGFINIPQLAQKVEEDINIANAWKPGTIKEYKKGRIIYP